MFTVEMEVKNKNSHNSDFYVPASSEFKKYPRTANGIKKAIISLCKNLKNENLCITDFNITVYEGKVYYYTRNEDKKVLFKLNKNLNEIMYNDNH